MTSNDQINFPPSSKDPIQMTQELEAYLALQKEYMAGAVYLREGEIDRVIARLGEINEAISNMKAALVNMSEALSDRNV